MIVYDTTCLGLNKAVWAPWFLMSTVAPHLRSVVSGTLMSDCDVEEMFLNFMLESKICPYVGVDVSVLYPVIRG